jgi:hypothetical protein
LLQYNFGADKPSATHAFWTWTEKWEMVQFTAKEDQWHDARLVAKYDGLLYAVTDKDNKIGTMSHN